MAVMIKIEGLAELSAKLKAKGRKGKDAEIIVGYTKRYALWVHEAPMVLKGLPRRKPSKGRYWDPIPRAQSKFLEAPARELNNSGELGRIVREAFIRNATMAQALALAGLRLQRESQLRVPVDFGFLKSSAVTRKVKG